MRRFRSRRRRTRGFFLGVAIVVVAAAGYYFMNSGEAGPEGPTDGSTVAEGSTGAGGSTAHDGSTLASAGRGGTGGVVNPYPGVPEKGDAANTTSDPSAGLDPEKARQLVASARQLLEKKAFVPARQQLSEAMELGLGGPLLVQARADLVRLANETIFSNRILSDDPLVSRYVVKSGDTLGRIAKRHGVTGELLARVNGIRNMNMIRLGQTLKLIEGPFHARVNKVAFRIDVYLQNTFVQSFPVGLGADDGTPAGQWTVKTKLVNPTFYPPRGGRIIPADDPKNPLGERWIGLEGVGGEAVGQQRYGIHGTIDPSSIGRSVSMGCIRMHNADVELLYDLLIPGKSSVVVVP